MRPGDICVAIGDHPHYVDVTIAHSDLASNARLARNIHAHPQVGADADAKEADKYKKYGAVRMRKDVQILVGGNMHISTY